VNSALCVTSSPDQRHRNPAPEHHGRGLRVDERVELGGRRDVALADRTAHPDDPLEPVAHVGVALEHQRDVRQRPGRDEHHAGLDQLGEEVRRVHLHDRGGRLGQRRAVETALAVHVRRRRAASGAAARPRLRPPGRRRVPQAPAP